MVECCELWGRKCGLTLNTLSVLFSVLCQRGWPQTNIIYVGILTFRIWKSIRSSSIDQKSSTESIRVGVFSVYILKYYFSIKKYLCVEHAAWNWIQASILHCGYLTTSFRFFSTIEMCIILNRCGHSLPGCIWWCSISLFTHFYDSCVIVRWGLG